MEFPINMNAKLLASKSGVKKNIYLYRFRVNEFINCSPKQSDFKTAYFVILFLWWDTIWGYEIYTQNSIYSVFFQEMDLERSKTDKVGTKN